MKIKNIYCPICHRQTYFTGKVVYESKRTQVIEWRCSDCGAILKSRHDKLGGKYNQRIKKGNPAQTQPFGLGRETTGIYYSLKLERNFTPSAH
jgi:hypothetical protein